MERKIIVMVCIIGLFLVPPGIFGQESDISLFQQWSSEERKDRLDEVIEIPLENQQIIFHMSKDSTIRVTHILDGVGYWAADSPRMIKVLPGEHSNLHVTDKDDDTYPFFWEGETFEESEYVILQLKLSNYRLFVSYDLEFMELIDDKLWRSEIKTPHDVILKFDESINTVFSNSRAIEISEASGINCIGCNMLMEYLDNEEPFMVKVFVNEDDLLTELDDSIEILSDGKILDFEFNPEINEIYFKTEKPNQLFQLTIPTSIIFYPYEVYLTDMNDNILDQTDKIKNTESSQNESSAKVSFRSNSIGQISIIGSTESEYENELSRIEERDIAITEPSVVEEEIKVQEEDMRDILENWNPDNVDSGDNDILFIIIGIIVVMIIIGIIIKTKKKN